MVLPAEQLAEGLVPAEVHAVLLRVPGLKKGRSAAREKARVRAVDRADVDRTLFSLPPAVRAMVLVQRLTGCRPQEVVGMRADEIDSTGEVWEYRPGRYKTQHLNPDTEPDRERVIFLGPQAQQVLQPFMSVAGGGFLFAPGRSEVERNAKRAAVRITPPRSRSRPRPTARSRPPRDCYTVAAYRKAVTHTSGAATGR